MVNFHIVYTESAVFLSKKPYERWQSIQDEFPDYKASLGPWTAEDTVDYLQQEYSTIEPAAATQVESFLNSDAVVLVVRFRDEGLLR